MRVRLHMASGGVVDAEEYSTDNGVTWAPIQLAQVAQAMTATTGYTVVRDVFSGQWRAFRNVAIESIGPAADLTPAVTAEVERRIAETLARELPRRVQAKLNPPPPGNDPDKPPAGRQP